MELRTRTLSGYLHPRYIDLLLFAGALLLYGMLPSNNYNYADDSLRWAFGVASNTGLINSHHLYLQGLRVIYHALTAGLDLPVEPQQFLSIYSACWGAVGLVALYRLLTFLNYGRFALSGALICGFTTNYWLYSIVGDCYVPATAAMIMGAYCYLKSMQTSAAANYAAWASAAAASFTLMILHHQAYAIFVVALAASLMLVRGGADAKRAIRAFTVLGLTGLVSLSIYGATYAKTPNPENHSFRSFVSGYAESFNALPDQKKLSLSVLINAAAGQARAILPYYVIYKSERMANSIQQRFPYRNVYPYPYLVRNLSAVGLCFALLGIAVFSIAGLVLAPIGLFQVIRERKAEFALLLSTLPQAMFFIWWEGISDEFWIWSLPMVAILMAKGTAQAKKPRLGLLNAGVAGLFMSSLLGAVLLFNDPANDIDAVNQQYLQRVKTGDLVIGFDEIQSAARAKLTMEKNHFQYFNIFIRASTWNDDSFEELKQMAETTLAGSGRVYVSPYLLSPPTSNMVGIRLKNRQFDAQRQTLIQYLQALDQSRIEWMPMSATVPGYF